jgi:hypothetical protein
MIFIVFISAFLALSVLLASTVLIVWSLRKEGGGVFLAKSVGITVFFLTLIGLLCILFFKVKYWKQGYFETPMVMSVLNHKRETPPIRERILKRLEQLKKQKAENRGQETGGGDRP